MTIEIQTALIAATVALITAGVTVYFSYNQIQRERTRWLFDLKRTYALELYKIRFSEYPRLLRTIGKLSHGSATKVTPDIAHEVSQEINEWFYSAGGLVADTRTRGAVLGLRQVCRKRKEGPRPENLHEWRNATVFMLRRDLDLLGRESFEPEESGPLLAQIKSEMDKIESSNQKKS